MYLSCTNIVLGDIEEKGAIIYSRGNKYKLNLLIEITRDLLLEGKRIGIVTDVEPSIFMGLLQGSYIGLVSELLQYRNSELHFFSTKDIGLKTEKIRNESYSTLLKHRIDTLIVDTTELSNEIDLVDTLKEWCVVPIITREISLVSTIYNVKIKLPTNDIVERILLESDVELLSRYNECSDTQANLLIRTSHTKGVRGLRVDNFFTVEEVHQYSYR